MIGTINRLDLVTNNFQEHLKKEETWRTEHKLLHETQDIELQHNFNDINARIDTIQHVINTTCVIRDNSDYKDIKSIIYMGDTSVLSEKKFSKFTKWLYKKLFGWTIEDYHWGNKIQRSVF